MRRVILLLVVASSHCSTTDTGPGGAGAGGASSSNASGGGAGAEPCGTCPSSAPHCDAVAQVCVECLIPGHCEPGSVCVEAVCCFDDGVDCTSDDDCCGASLCQRSGACGTFEGCIPNGSGICQSDADCCSNRCDVNQGGINKCLAK